MNSKTAIYQLKTIQKLIRGKEMRLAACCWNKKWHTLIATILSAVTRDEVTIPVCEELFKKYKSLEELSKAKQKTIEKIIKRVNFHKTKAKNIIKTSKLLKNKNIPETTEELIQLPGVGRKVANVYLVEAHNLDKIGVDTHVKRISNKLGWTENHAPDKIEKDLEKLFPKKYWNQINETLVTFGKSYGTSRKREDEVLETIKNKKD